MRLRGRMRGPFRLAVSLAVWAGILSGGSGGVEMKASDDLWTRTHRVFACEAGHRARYPSIARNAAGELVVLFTQVSEEQESAGGGDVVMIRSGDRGETWSEAVRVYEGEAGEPRTMGSLTTLASGELLTVVTETGKDGGPVSVRMLRSGDGGRNWEAGESGGHAGAVDARPHGRLVELADGTLIMPVYGVAGEGDGGKLWAGIARSHDGGATWGRELSIIAADAGRDFRNPVVLSTSGESMVAIVESGEELWRVRSGDGGRTWSGPEQVLLGREPALVRIEGGALACLASKGGQWGYIWAAFSCNDGESWRCDRKVMEHPGEPGGHFGWATGLALDRENLIVVFGETRRPVRSMDGPEAAAPPSPEAERITVVFFEREAPSPEPATGWETTPRAERDRWEPVESFSQSDMPFGFCRTSDGGLIGAAEEGDSLSRVWGGPGRGGASAAKYVSGPATQKVILRSTDEGRTWKKEPMELPPGYRGSPRIACRLASGRILCTITEWLLVEWNYEDNRVINHRGGYAIWNADHQAFHASRLAMLYSDDEGKTWQGTDRDVDYAPFQWAIPGERVFDRSDGTVVMSIWGCMSVEDGWGRLDSVGLIRSKDGGESWGDVSIIAHDKERRWSAYNETDIAVVSDDVWAAFMRTEYRGVGNEGAWMSRSVTTDGGYTWSAPELCFIGGVPKLVKLADGGIALGSSGGLRFTYDLGRTWSRVRQAGSYVSPLSLDEDTILMGDGQRWGSFSVWRRTAAGEEGSP